MSGADRLRVAVVGAGIGRAHVRGYEAVPELFDLRALCDIDLERARPVAEEHGIPRVVRDLSAMCRMDDVEVIDICTPPHLHFTLADARVSQELITAMYYSAETGAGVDLPIGPDHPRYASWLPRS